MWFGGLPTTLTPPEVRSYPKSYPQAGCEQWTQISTLKSTPRLWEYESRGARQAMLGLADIDGVLRGKYVGFDKLKSLFVKGGGFCDCVFGWDVDDQLYDGGAVTGWHTGSRTPATG